MDCIIFIGKETFLFATVFHNIMVLMHFCKCSLDQQRNIQKHKKRFTNPKLLIKMKGIVHP